MRVTGQAADRFRPDRRQAMAMLAATTGAMMLGSGVRAAAGPPLQPHARDWQWLVGNWDVWHRRLKQRLAESRDWQVFSGRSSVWLTMDGLGTIDDNLLDLPAGLYRATGIRAFDPASGRWAIWWLDGRNPTRIDPPVFGGFTGDGGTFFGDDRFEGRPIKVRFQWRDIHGPRPHWQQSFSADGGTSWEMNWENRFTRTAPVPTPFPAVAGAPGDFDFLVGRWAVRHRKLRKRLAGSQDWELFEGSLVNWPVLGGAGNVGDNLMLAGSGTIRGVGIRAFDPATRQWLSWWLDGRDPVRIGAPLRGGFVDRVGDFRSEDVVDGRPIKVHVRWSRITARSARWEQAFSADGGQSWETNWISDFTRGE